jgi:hypothetical protein
LFGLALPGTEPADEPAAWPGGRHRSGGARPARPLGCAAGAAGSRGFGGRRRILGSTGVRRPAISSMPPAIAPRTAPPRRRKKRAPPPWGVWVGSAGRSAFAIGAHNPQMFDIGQEKSSQ